MIQKPNVEWAPHWAEGKIVGSHNEYDPLEPEQKIVMTCKVCGDTSQTTCDKGNARGWITLFAVTHRKMHPW